MSSSFKRVLTDEGRESLIASSTAPHSTPDDLSALLRSVGSRVRKNVTEGYTSPPSSDSLQFNATGRVFFRSASDTLRDVFPRVPNPTPIVSPRKTNKRAHPDGYDSDGGVDEDKDAETGMINQDSDEDAVDIITEPQPRNLNRPIKALRKPRKPMATRSLPAGEFTLGDNKFSNDATMKPVAEEDDWSSGNFTAQGFDDEDQSSSFQTMVLS